MASKWGIEAFNWRRQIGDSELDTGPRRRARLLLGVSYEGVSENDGKLLKEAFGIETMADLANY